MDGYERLVAALELLLEDARNKAFDDFDSTLSTPKVALIMRLNALIDNTKNGLYDN